MHFHWKLCAFVGFNHVAECRIIRRPSYYNREFPIKRSAGGQARPWMWCKSKRWGNKEKHAVVFHIPQIVSHAWPICRRVTLWLSRVGEREDAFNLIYWCFVFGGALALVRVRADNPASKLEIGRSPHAACEWADLSIDSWERLQLVIGTFAD